MDPLSWSALGGAGVRNGEHGVIQRGGHVQGVGARLVRQAGRSVHERCGVALNIEPEATVAVLWTVTPVEPTFRSRREMMPFRPFEIKSLAVGPWSCTVESHGPTIIGLLMMVFTSRPLLLITSNEPSQAVAQVPSTDGKLPTRT
jgi:hypothetical protein